VSQSAQTENQYPSPLMGWMTVAVLFVLYILSFTDRNIMAFLIEPIKRDFELSDFQISLLMGPAFGVVYALCAVPIGFLLDRYGRRIVLYFSVTLWSVAAAGCGLSPNVATLVGARAMLGAGEAGFSTGAYSIIGDSFPPNRLPLAMSIFAMGGVMGSGIANLLGGPLVDALQKNGDVVVGALTLAPWRQALILTGVPGIILALLIFFFRETRKPGAPARQGYGEAIAYMVKHGRFYFSVFVGISVYYVVIVGLQIWTPEFLARVHNWPKLESGVYMGFAQIAAATTLPLHGWAVNALYSRGVKAAHMLWCIGCALVGIGFGTAAYLAADPMLCVILFGGFMAAGMSVAGIGPALVQMATPAYLRGRMSALYVVATGLIAVSFGPTTVAYVTDFIWHDEAKLGWSLITTVCVLLPLSMAVLSLGRHRLAGLLATREAAPA
jgi:MFS family permease